MWLIAGLGNPGARYADTRHNAGFWYIDALAQRLRVELRKHSRFDGFAARVSIDQTPCLLVKPQAFMNNSGIVLRQAAHFYRIPLERLLVAYDELDLPSGSARFKFDGGHAGHNGLRNICQQFASHGCHRLRIGIDHPGNKQLVTNYVLGAPTVAQRAAIGAVIDRAVAVTSDYLTDNGRERAMQQLHTPAPTQ